MHQLLTIGEVSREAYNKAPPLLKGRFGGIVYLTDKASNREINPHHRYTSNIYKSRYPPLQEKIFGLSIFLFAQNLWYAETKNGDLDSTVRTAKSPFKKGVPENCANKKREDRNNRSSLKEAATYSPT